ncbi:hypothetical protein Ferp_0545 [Ferroglobus placidus DSM 10642]|uniref:Uncharacterized protein n=1 Tax=Ferroglobus placidus (strain DSM 10642 / AEDII12DO) TaxID=589924 RepID=D3S385_FERPA|nr:hypothetical protein [Ferroglobus placidus]ADC64718.1 hypothetical protein Ferp_0545 [Ferroglobus placidus DSM 10642]
MVGLIVKKVEDVRIDCAEWEKSYTVSGRVLAGDGGETSEWVWKEFDDALHKAIDRINSSHPSHFSGYSHSLAGNVIITLNSVLKDHELRVLSRELGAPIRFRKHYRASGNKSWRGWKLNAEAFISFAARGNEDTAEISVKFWEEFSTSAYDYTIEPQIHVRNFYRTITRERAADYMKDLERLKLLNKAEFKECEVIAVTKKSGRYLVLKELFEDSNDRLYIFRVEGRVGKVGARYYVDVAGKTLWTPGKKLLSRDFVAEPPLEVKKELLMLSI